MDPQRDNLQLQLLPESSSVTIKPGMLTRIDKFLRRTVPGYNYLRGKRVGSRTSLEARGVSSGFIVSAKIRARIANSNANANANLGSGRNADVFLEAGISKSEFCSKLDHLLRRKLLEQQREPEDILLEAIQVQTVDLEVEVPEEELAMGAQEGDIQMEDVQMEDVHMDDEQTGDEQTGDLPTGLLQPGGTQPGETHPGESQPGETHPGESQPGETQPGETQPGETHPGVTQPGESQPGESQPGETQPGDNQSQDSQQVQGAQQVDLQVDQNLALESNEEMPGQDLALEEPDLNRGQDR